MITIILLILLIIGYLIGAVLVSMWLEWDWLHIPDLIKALLFPIFIFLEK